MAHSKPLAQSSSLVSGTGHTVLPEWRELDVDDAAWIASIEASRREQFAELENL